MLIDKMFSQVSESIWQEVFDSSAWPTRDNVTHRRHVKEIVAAAT